MTASVKDALRLGCCGVGITIYPGSDNCVEMLEEAKEIVREAKYYGLVVVIWSYPRGEGISKEGETALDICAYAAHIAALLGAHIIKVKPPAAFIEQKEAKVLYENAKFDYSSLSMRVRHIMQSCFNGKRLVVFSGGASKSEYDIIKEIQEIKEGGGSGSIIGRNSFQRQKDEALQLLKSICKIYEG